MKAEALKKAVNAAYDALERAERDLVKAEERMKVARKDVRTMGQAKARRQEEYDRALARWQATDEAQYEMSGAAQRDEDEATFMRDAFN